MDGRSGARPRPPATTTTSCPANSSVGHAVPNGPRSPSMSPGFTRAIASPPPPTARTVCTSRDASDASPLTLTGISPMPNTYIMVNWPGRYRGRGESSAGSNSSVTVPGRSRVRLCTRTMRGTIGSGAGTARVSATASIDVEPLQAHRLEALHQHRQETLEQGIAEAIVGLAFVAQAPRIQRDGTGQVQCARVVAPTVWRQQPGQADNLALTHGFELHCTLARGSEFQCNPAIANQINPVGGILGVEQVFVGVEARIFGAAGS